MALRRLLAHPSGPRVLSLVILACFLSLWEASTRSAHFDGAGKTADQLLTMEFNGDIIKDASGNYVFNPDKVVGFPGPMKVWKKSRQELSEAFTVKGTNDHGIGLLVFYTIKRFLLGFAAGSIVAICLGIIIGLSKPLYLAFNPFIQVLKPISPLAWMPLMLYSVKDPFWTAILVVFLASLWPTVANTAFGVSSIRREYLNVASMLEMNYLRRLVTVVLPAAAPAIIAGLRISFGSALVAVVPAEMLLGELGAGYLTWIEWNNLDISGVIFAILAVGIVGYALDYAFGRLAGLLTYSEA